MFGQTTLRHRRTTTKRFLLLLLWGATMHRNGDPAKAPERREGPMQGGEREGVAESKEKGAEAASSPARARTGSDGHVGAAPRGSSRAADGGRRRSLGLSRRQQAGNDARGSQPRRNNHSFTMIRSRSTVRGKRPRLKAAAILVDPETMARRPTVPKRASAAQSTHPERSKSSASGSCAGPCRRTSHLKWPHSIFRGTRSEASTQAS
ncbi:hypothetical protein V5799_012612 [Amblyomma americanum]|uniref:Secreted protein n=1 Tax=Amblyomma americanum TaxID=6943 RepID=A0AAQ4EDW0_AMBAM